MNGQQIVIYPNNGIVRHYRKGKLIYSDKSHWMPMNEVGWSRERGKGKLGEHITKEHKEAYWDDRYIHYLDCSIRFTGAYIYQNLEHIL